MSALDLWMPRFDAREHHASHGVVVPPAEALCRALAMPLAPDAIVRTLFRLRGVSTRGTLEQFFAQSVVLERGAASYVVGLLAGRGGFLRAPSAEAWQHAPPWHALKIVFDLRAITAVGGTLVSTETRVLANGAAARRAFRLYWSVVGPFSTLIRRRWLRAIVRVCADG